MRLNANATFEVDPGEQITFEVRRTGPPCVAGFEGEGWDSCGPVSEPDESTKAKMCKAKSVVCNNSAMAITVTFSPNVEDDDQYTVTITGESGEPFTDFFFPPPKINGKVYNFHVSQS